MAQISLYIDDTLARNLTAAAITNGYSLSKYVSAIITEKLRDEAAKEDEKRAMLSRLYGSLADIDDFTEQPEIPLGTDTIRRFDLI